MPKPKCVEENDRKIGRKIRELRLQRELTQTELADHLHLTFQQVQKYEKGANRVSSNSLIKIAGLFGVTVAQMLEGITANPQPGGVLNDVIRDLGQTRQGAELARTWSLIEGWEKRSLLLKMARFLAKQPLMRPPVTRRMSMRRHAAQATQAGYSATERGR